MSRVKERNSAIEILRIICMVMIVAGHFTHHGGFDMAHPLYIGAGHGFLRFVEIGGGLGADIFVMISGYFLVNSTRQKPKKIALMWLQGVFYSAGLFLVMGGLGYEQLDHLGLAGCFKPVCHSVWWFLTVYIVLYIVHPYINLALKAMDMRQYRRMLWLMLVLWSVLPFFTRRTYGSNELVWFVCLYAFGGYVRLFGESIKLSARSLLALAGACHAASFGLVMVYDILALKNPELAGVGILYTGIQQLPTVATACFIFAGFTKLRMGHSAVINTVASATFGVYLIHDHPMVRAFIWGPQLFNNGAYQYATNLIPHALMAIAAVYFACTAIELVRIHTVERLLSAVWDAGEKGISAAAAKLKK